MSVLGTKFKWMALHALAFLAACTQTIEPDTDAFGFDYYPMRLGDERIYYTQEIFFKLSGTVDTLTYLVKEIVEDTIKQTDGNYQLLLGRYSTSLDTTKWQKDSLWMVEVNNQRVLLSEATKAFVKLVFPVANNTQWDGNAKNADKEEIYVLTEVGGGYAYDTLSFGTTARVVHKDLRDPAKITEDDYRFEVFAREVGLVHRYKLKLNYCSKCSENGVVEEGYILDQKLISFETKS